MFLYYLNKVTIPFMCWFMISYLLTLFWMGGGGGGKNYPIAKILYNKKNRKAEADQI